MLPYKNAENALALALSLAIFFGPQLTREWLGEGMFRKSFHEEEKRRNKLGPY